MSGSSLVELQLHVVGLSLLLNGNNNSATAQEMQCFFVMECTGGRHTVTLFEL